MAELGDKQVEVNGKIIGTSTIRMSVKTALWLISSLTGIVMTILTWSYFDLKKDWAEAEAKKAKKEQLFIEKVDKKLDKSEEDITQIRIDQSDIRGDIKLILDRQTRDNPIRADHSSTVDRQAPPE